MAALTGLWVVGGCVIGPKDGDPVASRSGPVSFSAAYHLAGKPAVVEQLNEISGGWEARGNAVSATQASADPAGNSWYTWSLDVPLNSGKQYWHWDAHGAMSLWTNMRVRSTSDNVPYRTFNNAPATTNCINAINPFNGVTAYAQCSTGETLALKYESTVRGDTSCAYGAKNCNACVNDVQAAFRALPGQVAKIRYKSRGDSTLPPFNANLAAFAGDKSHVQAIARIPGVGQDTIGTGRGPWFALTRARPDNVGGAGVFLVQLGDMSTNGGRGIRQSATGEPPTDRATQFYYPSSGVDHPGGLQMIGQYAAVAADCDDDSKCGRYTFVDFYDFSRPGFAGALLQRFRVGDQGEAGGGTNTITSVAISKLQSGHYLMFVYGKDISHHGWFYVSDQTDITAQTKWLYRSDWQMPLPANASSPLVVTRDGVTQTVGDIYKAKHEYQNTTLVTECGSGDMYMFGMGNAGFTPAAVIFGAEVPGDNYLALHKLSRSAAGTVSMDPVGLRVIDPGEDEYCTFRAGSSLHATPDHTLVLYCSARKANTDAFNRPDSKLKMQEFAP